MKQPNKKALRLAAHALRWAGFGYKNKADQMAVGDVRLWLIDLAGHERRPHVLAEQVELYAIHTGEFYTSHMTAAATGMSRLRWRRWVRQQVLYRWNSECEKAWMMPVEIARCARGLQRYYQARVAEMGK